MDPSINTAFCLAFEKLINSALEFDPATRLQLSELNEVLSIRCTQPTFTIYCRGDDNGVSISSYNEEAAGVEITGSAKALFSLLKQPTNLSGSGVTVSGKVGVLQQWQSVLQNLDIDWEDAISRVFGNLAGPIIASQLRRSADWAQDQNNASRIYSKTLLPKNWIFSPTKQS